MCICRKRCKVLALDNLNNCSICLDIMHEKLYIIELECNHRFHAGCILKWVTQNQCCPLCRSTISKDLILTSVLDYISRWRTTNFLLFFRFLSPWFWFFPLCFLFFVLDLDYDFIIKVSIFSNRPYISIRNRICRKNEKTYM